ncbi:MAG: hypothetical protein NVS3B10_29350 [Polyangiales bacterium]
MAITPNFVQVQPNSTGLKLDTAEVTVATVVVERQIIAIASPDATTPLRYLLPNADGSLTATATAIGGAMLSMPAATANGTALSSGPTGTEITIQPGGSVTYTIAASAPGAPPTLYRTTANPVGSASAITDQINLASGVLAYVTAWTAPTVGLLTYRTI